MLDEPLVYEEGVAALIDGASMCHSFLEAIDDHPYERLNYPCAICDKPRLRASSAVVWSQVMSHRVNTYIAEEWLGAGRLPREGFAA